MDAALLVKLERLMAAKIELVPDLKITTHYIFARDGFASLVEKRNDGFGHIGASGMVNERGFAALLWRGGRPVFVGRGFEEFATPEQVTAIRAFDRDLNEALM